MQGIFSCRELFGVGQPRAFHNLQDDEQDKIRDYKLTVYLCTGSDSEKLEWFKTINIAGEKLSDQELRNAVYSGVWVTDAKRYFSKRNCAAGGLGGNYLKGISIRQEYLETAIQWLVGGKSEIETYMGKHQHDRDAKPLWEHFCAVIDWVKKVFPNYRKEMKGLDWGALYGEFKDRNLDAEKLEQDITRLMQDDDVKKKSGIYEYLLTGDEHHLDIRAFTLAQKRSAFERQQGKCPMCEKQFDIDEMEGDHITPWREGGKTEPENCQMLCKECNRRKGGR